MRVRCPAMGNEAFAAHLQGLGIGAIFGAIGGGELSPLLVGGASLALVTSGYAFEKLGTEADTDG